MEVASVFDMAGVRVAIGRTGVLFRPGTLDKLGGYIDETNSVFDAEQDQIGSFSKEGGVYDATGFEVGAFAGELLSVQGNAIGKCIGPDGAKALAVLLFQRGEL